MTPRYPAATRSDHQSFCLTERWTEVRNARGKAGNHVVYELTLPDGRILRTRISHPLGRDTYGQMIWSHILRDQLEVSEPEFWACVKEKVLPRRSAPAVPAETLPVGIVSQLLANGVPESEVRELSRTEAIQRLTDIWSQPQEPGGGEPGGA